MIRSVKITTKYSNLNKKHSLECFQELYSITVLKIINHIWNNGYQNINKTVFNASKKHFNLDSNLNNEFLKQFDNNIFTQRMLQACGTQASSILRSCTVKNKQRQYVVSKLMKEKKNVSRLQSLTDSELITVPDFKLLQPQIDNRFFDIQYSDIDKEYDGWIQIRLFKNCKPTRIPFKKHKKFLEYEGKGKILNSIRLCKDYISLSFELPDKEKRSEGIKLGADQGTDPCLALSDGQMIGSDKHGHTLNSIMKILSRKKKGSLGFERTQEHRKNYIHWSLNQLNFNNVKTVNLERLFQVGKGTNKGRFLSSFTYTEIKKKLEAISETEGFVVSEVSNEFRSQRCSNCGWTQKSSRKGKVFECSSCSFATHADLNASMNLVEDQLTPIPKSVREEKLNRKGFFWNLSGITDSSGELIVPHVQKQNSVVNV